MDVLAMGGVMAGAAGSPACRDAIANVAAAALFSFGLAVGSAVPLRAVDVGYGVGEVGLLLAASAISQMVVRLFTSGLMRKLSERVLLAGAVPFLMPSMS
ncbi:hypothetical protein, partial [Nocardioides massiliensis]|uniref:hypothetical protein n=1 Tax=Nocardioides massiliensis TaxID=1325935 RepID=UPI001C6855A6